MVKLCLMEKSRELERLFSQYSWNSFVLNDDGVRVATKKRDTRISFPVETWDDDEINEEGQGVWADIRLREIHSLMSKHKISSVWEVGSGNGSVCLGLAKLGYETIAIEPL